MIVVIKGDTWRLDYGSPEYFESVVLPSATNGARVLSPEGRVGSKIWRHPIYSRIVAHTES